jgi:hypothetical protein
MRWFSRRRKRLPRRSVLGGRPVPLPAIRREDLNDGRVGITVAVPSPGWIRWLGGPASFERTYRLDSLGREVYEACDGQNDVKTMIRRFAEKHQVSQAEAEVAVTTFLKTLMTKGLVAMEMDRKPK